MKWFDTAKRGKSHAILFIDPVGLAINYDPLKDLADIDYFVKNYRQFDNKRSIGYDDYENLIKIVSEILKNKPEQYYKIFEHQEVVGNDIIKWTDEIKETDFRYLDNSDLIDLLKIYTNYQIDLWKGPFIYSYYFYFNDIFLDEFVRNLEKNGKLDEDLLKHLSSPENLTMVGKEKLELLKLTQDYINSDDIYNKNLKEHSKKFAFLNRYIFWGDGFTYRDFVCRQNELILKGEDYIKQELENLEPVSIDYEKYNLTDYEKMIIKLARKASFSMNFADEATNYCIHNLNQLFYEIGKRLDINYEKLVSMRFYEIIESLNNNQLSVPKEELYQRFKEHTIIFTNGISEVLTGEKLEEYRRKQKEEIIDTSLNVIKGTVAISTDEKIIGKARLIMSLDEINEFRSGEILVTEMTNPTYVPIMEKSKAIITDEGGMLCHAAIVSRELNKPSIIGTKLATKLIKSGDLLELDFKSGKIRILK